PGLICLVTKVGDNPYSVEPGSKATALTAFAEIADRSQNFELKLGNTVAVFAQRQTFDNDIGDVPVGGRVPRALLCLDQRIGKLVAASLVNAQLDALPVDFASVRPNASNPRNFSLASCECCIRV